MTDTDTRYRNLITQLFVMKLNAADVVNVWSQQDGVICHTVRKTIQLLHEIFLGRVLSRFG